MFEALLALFINFGAPIHDCKPPLGCEGSVVVTNHKMHKFVKEEPKGKPHKHRAVEHKDKERGERHHHSHPSFDKHDGHNGKSDRGHHDSKGHDKGHEH